MILFCANYKKEKLEKVRQRYRDRNCLKCVKKAISKTKKSHSSTPVVKLKSDAAKRSGVQTNQELFYTTLSPISQRHNTLERMRRENIVRRNLLEKSLEAIIAEARRDLLRAQDTASSLGSEATVEERAEATDYVNMNPSHNNNGNNNSKLMKNTTLTCPKTTWRMRCMKMSFFNRNPTKTFMNRLISMLTNLETLNKTYLSRLDRAVCLSLVSPRCSGPGWSRLLSHCRG